MGSKRFLERLVIAGAICLSSAVTAPAVMLTVVDYQFATSEISLTGPVPIEIVDGLQQSAACGLRVVYPTSEFLRLERVDALGPNFYAVYFGAGTVAADLDLGTTVVRLENVSEGAPCLFLDDVRWSRSWTIDLNSANATVQGLESATDAPVPHFYWNVSQRYFTPEECAASPVSCGFSPWPYPAFEEHFNLEALRTQPDEPEGSLTLTGEDAAGTRWVVDFPAAVSATVSPSLAINTDTSSWGRLKAIFE